MIFNVVVVQGLMNNFDKFREFVKEQHPKELMTTVEFLALRYSYFSHSPQSITLVLYHSSQGADGHSGVPGSQVRTLFS